MTLNNVLINSTGLNTTINFSGTVTLGDLTINSTNVYFSNITSVLIAYKNNTVIQSGNQLKDIVISFINSNLFMFPSSNLVNYNYSYNQNDQNGYSGGTTFISNGLIGMVVNFFSLTPVIGTIMGICILIAGIVILVIYIRKLKLNEQGDTIHG